MDSEARTPTAASCWPASSRRLAPSVARTARTTAQRSHSAVALDSARPLARRVPTDLLHLDVAASGRPSATAWAQREHLDALAAALPLGSGA